MKKSFLPIVLLFALPIFFLISCSKYTVEKNPSAGAVNTTITTNLTSGKWILSSITQNTEDKTSQFADVIFNFSADGTIIATAKGTQTVGSWKFTAASNCNRSPAKDAFTLNMGTGNELDLLNKSWNLISVTSATLKLDSPELLEDEHLLFTKQ